MDSMIKANDEGYEAGYAGATFQDNPYAEGTDEARGWEAGLEQSLQTQRDVRDMGI